MPYRPTRQTKLALFAFLLALAVTAGAAGVDDDLRLAAKLHKAGDAAAAVRLWEKWAGAGDIDSAYNLAVIHQHGDSVALDYVAAMRWYRLAADKGDKNSQFQIGLMYQAGQGVAADADEAHRWFTVHLKHHLHHQHEPKMLAWRQQALVLIEERDRWEQLTASRGNSTQVVADLKRRAGMTGTRPTETAAVAPTTLLR